MENNTDKEIKLAPSERIKADVNYIKNEIIAKQPNGNYCKWSRILKAIAVVNISRDQYETYWERQYKANQTEYIKQIQAACKDKFENGLMDTNEFIEMVEKSNDNIKEKKLALGYLKGLIKK